MKKMALISLALLVFFLPFMNMQQANAAVASKVVNQTAKKIAKEAIKDTVVDMSFNMVMNYKYVPKDERIKAKQGFEMVCMPVDKKPDGDCGNPMQVKKLTTADKNTLDAVVESNLDKKITGGIGASKWGKFVDWLVPVFALGLGVTVIDYAINGDVSDLFDDIAFDSLNDLGLLENVVVESDIATKLNWGGSVQYDGWVYVGTAPYDRNTMPFKVYVKTGIGTEYELGQGDSIVARGRVMHDGYMFSTNIYVGSRVDLKIQFNPYKNFTISNLPSSSRELTSGEVNYFVNGMEVPKHVVVRASSIPIKHDKTSSGIPKTNKPNTPIKIIAPGAFPFEESGSGVPVYPYVKPDGTTGFKTEPVKKPDGTTVPGRDVLPDNVIVKDPTIINNPDGSTTVVPAPTPENPNPKPGDGEIIPPKNEEPTPEFPEGETCSATLKLPKFTLLFNTLSTSFPFSIPWDLKSGFDAIFLEMGKDKPKFSYKFNFNGAQKEWKIELPSYFDSWKPFTDSMLIFVFDVGIIYGIYRLMQGGGS